MTQRQMIDEYNRNEIISKDRVRNYAVYGYPLCMEYGSKQDIVSKSWSWVTVKPVLLRKRAPPSPLDRIRKNLYKKFFKLTVC